MVKADRSTLTRIYRATNFQAGGGTRWKDRIRLDTPLPPSTPRYCDPLGRVDRADRLSEFSYGDFLGGFNASRLLTDWIKGIIGVSLNPGESWLRLRRQTAFFSTGLTGEEGGRDLVRIILVLNRRVEIENCL